MNFEKSKIEITWSGKNIGLCIKEGGKFVDWSGLTREDQLKVLNSLADMYGLFSRFLKEE